MIYTGSCHCKAVQFELEAPSEVNAIRCNCSICAMTGLLHLIVPKSKLRNLIGMENLSCYRFNQKVAKHYFCSTCGVKPFYIPRSNPDGYSVNVLCLSPAPDHLTIEDFDGTNWEQFADGLRHHSKESD